MVQINRGSNSTLRSESAEGQLTELLLLMQRHESDISKNPANRDAVNASANFNTSSFNALFSLPCTQEINSSGQVVLVPTSYLLQTGFSGGGGTIKSNSIEGYLLELVSFLQIRELTAIKNPNQENRVSGNYDTDEQVFSGSVNFLFQTVISSSGLPTIDVNEYLLD